MAKRIIIFCDGTWNRPEVLTKVPLKLVIELWCHETIISPISHIFPKRMRDRTDLRLKSLKKNKQRKTREVPPVTNVVKLMRVTETRDSKGKEQVMLYLKGIGTNGWCDKILGGITGYGISENIQNAYRFIANNFDRGSDEIFLFGFSRGAYTARSLSGFLNEIGMLKKENMPLLPRAYAYYRFSPQERNDSKFGREFREELKKAQQPEYSSIPVQFIGVWDTVGALGVPLPILNLLTRKQVSFHNTKLCKNVTHAYQALALHELRSQFKPVLWTEKTDNQSVEQVWFAGAHSDIGGGLSKSGLSDIALKWMADKAEGVGMAINNKFLDQSCKEDIGQIPAISRRLSGTGVGRLIKWSSPHIRPIDPQEIESYLTMYFQEQNFDPIIKEKIFQHPLVAKRLEVLLEKDSQPSDVDKQTSREVVSKSKELTSPDKWMLPYDPVKAAEEEKKRGLKNILSSWNPAAKENKNSDDQKRKFISQLKQGEISIEQQNRLGYEDEPKFKIVDIESMELKSSS